MRSRSAEGVLVADRFRSFVRADLAVEPAAGVEPARFSGQRQAPLAEALFQKRLVQTRQVAHLADAHRVQILLHHLAHAGHLADIERRQERRFTPLATSRDAAMPMEQFRRVAAFMRSCRMCAAFRGGP